MTSDRKQRIRDTLAKRRLSSPPPPKQGGRPPANWWDDSPYIRPDIKSVLNSPDKYVRGAREDIPVHEAHFIREADKKNKSLPIMHVSWQQQGWFFELSEEEREALGRARRKSRGRDNNHYIKKRNGQYQLFYRESRIRHLWLAQVKKEGRLIWGYTLSKNLRTVWDREEIGRESWTEVCDLMDPEIPADLTAGPRRAVREIVRESLLVAITILKADEIVPEEIVRDPSYKLCLRMLCSEVTKRLQRRKSGIEDLLNEYASKVRDIIPDDAMVERVSVEDTEEATARLEDVDLAEFGF